MIKNEQEHFMKEALKEAKKGIFVSPSTLYFKIIRPNPNKITATITITIQI